MLETQAITAIPLLFTYKDTLFGNGFVAEVQATNGRALCVKEGDEFWMYGLNPGGMSAGGADPTAAHAEFRKTFSNILVDIAIASENFASFKATVEEFFNESNDGFEADWQKAVQAVRSGAVRVVGLEQAPADSPRHISVELKTAVVAADNRTAFESAIAA